MSVMMDTPENLVQFHGSKPSQSPYQLWQLHKTLSELIFRENNLKVK